jgi:hypothetical protein
MCRCLLLAAFGSLVAGGAIWHYYLRLKKRA